MKARSAVLAVAVLLLGLAAVHAATTDYSWTGKQAVRDSGNDYILDGTFTDATTSLTLTVSLPQWYTPFRNGVYYPNEANWTSGSVCHQAAPYPSLSFQEVDNGNKVAIKATVSSITCQSTYNSSTAQLRTLGTFSGLNNVTNQPFTGTFEIDMFNDGYQVKQWTAHTVTWAVTYN